MSAEKSPEQLFNLYLKSVGRGANLNLNVPPDREGRFSAYDSAALIGFKRLRDESFRRTLFRRAGVKLSMGNTRYAIKTLIDGDPMSCVSFGEHYQGRELVVEFPAVTAVNCIVLQEPIGMGQRVIRFTVRIENADGVIYTTGGTTIGHKRILTFPRQSASRIRLSIEDAKATPLIGEFNAYIIDERLIEHP